MGGVQEAIYCYIVAIMSTGALLYMYDVEYIRGIELAGQGLQYRISKCNLEQLHGLSS